jgi:phosphonate transport system substrate-binding protein
MIARYFLTILIIFTVFSGAFSCARADEVTLERVAADSINAEGLHIALEPEINVFEQRRRYSYITDYLSEKLGITVHVDIMSNYGQINDAFLKGSADIGFFGSFSYVLAHAQAEIEPIARPVYSADNSSMHRSYIFVRKDSGIRTTEDMKGKTLALVDRVTTAGYIFPLFYFKNLGINDIRDHFAHVYFAGSHDVAAWAVYMGEADVGGCKSTIFNALAEEYPDFKEQMVTLIESVEVPSDCLAVRKDLQPALKLRLKELLLNLDKSEKGKSILKHFGATKFILTTDEDYQVLYKMLERLEIDLTKYPYNE